MPAKAQSKLINLLPQEEFASSTVGRILTWLLSSFRVIVIFSEIVVMGAFMSRFWLDARNADLTDEIKQKEAIVVSYSQIESEFKKSQKKINAYTLQTKNQDFPLQIIDTLSKSMPSDIKLTVLSITDSAIDIKAESLTESSISKFIQILKKDNLFTQATVTQISTTKDNPSVNFTVKANKGGSI